MRRNTYHSSMFLYSFMFYKQEATTLHYRIPYTLWLEGIISETRGRAAFFCGLICKCSSFVAVAFKKVEFW